MLLSSYKRLLCQKDQWEFCHCLGKQLGWTFHMYGNSIHSGPSCYLHKEGSFLENVWHFSVNVVFQTLPPKNPQCKISFGNKICDWKIPTGQIAWTMKAMKEVGRTTHEQPFISEGAFPLRENIYCPLTYPHIMQFENERVQHRGFNHYLPVGSSDCNGHVYRIMPRRS